MSGSPQPLKKQIKGGPALFRNTKFANQAIDAINAFLSMAVSPSGIGRMAIGQGSATLDLNAVEARLSALEQATGLDQIQEVKSQMNIVTAALANASISVVCNANGTITVTLSFPGIQPQPIT